MKFRTLWVLLLALVLGLGSASCACGGEEEAEGDKGGKETTEGGDSDEKPEVSDKKIEIPGDGDSTEAKGGGDDDDDEDDGEERVSLDEDLNPLESRLQRLQRVSRKGKIRDGFQVTVLRVTLDEGTSKVRFRRREKGIQATIVGAISNNTGHTLYSGFLSGALILDFGGGTTKVQLSPDGLKPSASDSKPWRNGTSRLFEVSTFVFSPLMLEYMPKKTEVALMAVFEDPINFSFEAPVWRAEVDWLAVRGAAVSGNARVMKSEGLRAGPRGKASGKTQVGEDVELLYQKGDWVRVKAQQGEGWVEVRNLLFKDLKSMYGAKGHATGNDASDDLVAISVKGTRNEASPPEGTKIKDGQRFFLVDVSLQNKGEKDIKCTDFFVDFGPKDQRTPDRATSKFAGAMSCEKDKLAPGESTSGTLAFLRDRHDIPFAVGYSSPNKTFLLVDIWSKEAAKPYTR